MSLRPDILIIQDKGILRTGKVSNRKGLSLGRIHVCPGMRWDSKKMVKPVWGWGDFIFCAWRPTAERRTRSQETRNQTQSLSTYASGGTRAWNSGNSWYSEGQFFNSCTWESHFCAISFFLLWFSLAFSLVLCKISTNVLRRKGVLQICRLRWFGGVDSTFPILEGWNPRAKSQILSHRCRHSIPSHLETLLSDFWPVGVCLLWIPAVGPPCSSASIIPIWKTKHLAFNWSLYLF